MTRPAVAALRAALEAAAEWAAGFPLGAGADSRAAFDVLAKSEAALQVLGVALEAPPLANRVVFCIWCGESVAYGAPVPDNVKAAYDRAKAHDAVCSKNPLVARIAELERGEAPPEPAILPDTFVERAVRIAQMMPEPNMDEVVRLSAFEASAIRQRVAGGVRAVPAPQEGPQPKTPTLP